jgi:NADP-dependent 3-hydroxy acid dehydrogenase YdfG
MVLQQHYQYFKTRIRAFINLSSAAGVKEQFTAVLNLQLDEGLRHEVGNIRTTSIAPGAVESELKLGSSKVPILLKNFINYPQMR